MSVTNSLLEAFLLYSGARQEVIADNVARANSPGELSKDLELPKNFMELVKSSSKTNEVHIAKTSSLHMDGSKPRLKFKAKIDKDATDLKPNGNNINLFDQAKKAAENKILFDTGIEAYKKSANLVKIAVGKGR